MRTLLILAMLTGAAAMVAAQKTIPPPDDVKAVPADAKKTASGLAYKVITPGKGKQHPTSTSEVTVHYTGWTTDGKMFDSSVARGEPATFPLNRCDQGLDRRRPADGRRREDALLDSRAARLRWTPARRSACSCSTSSCSRSSRVVRAGGRPYRPGLPNPPALPVRAAIRSLIRRLAFWNRSASARFASSGTGPMRDQPACA